MMSRTSGLIREELPQLAALWRAAQAMGTLPVTVAQQRWQRFVIRAAESVAPAAAGFAKA